MPANGASNQPMPRPWSFCPRTSADTSSWRIVGIRCIRSYDASRTLRAPGSPNSNSSYTRSWPATSRLSSRWSSSVAKGVRFARNRIQTEVSTRTTAQRPGSSRFAQCSLINVKRLLRTSSLTIQEWANEPYRLRGRAAKRSGRRRSACSSLPDLISEQNRLDTRH